MAKARIISRVGFASRSLCENRAFFFFFGSRLCIDDLRCIQEMGRDMALKIVIRAGGRAKLCSSTLRLLDAWKREKSKTMCIAVFLWRAHPLYPFFLLHNRDEFHSRPTEPVAWWDNGEILGGRDGLAGGTWLACSRNGKIAFVTNVREVGNVPEPKSRGDLPVRFLESKKNPTEFAEEVVMEAHRYNGFNMILVDLCSKSMIYVTNRPKDDEALVSKVPPGIHVLSTASLDTPWPKASWLRSNFEKFLEKYGGGELPAEEMADKLMTDTTKADKTMLPGIYSVEFEYSLSSIFVEANTKQGCYGTRSISAVSAKTSGEVTFYEKYLQEESWKEHTSSYKMGKTGTG